MTASGKAAHGLRTFAADVAGGFFEITHRRFDLLGLALVFAVITVTAHPDLRRAGDEKPMDWPPVRHLAPLGEKAEAAVEVAVEVAVEASDRVTAANPQDLPRPQAAVAYWLSKKYRVAPEPLSVLVAEAYAIGGRTKLDPTLILAIMAIESSFNPFAQSAMGAQGLMQVMTGVHGDKYESLGGKLKAFDPVTNLRVGVRVLQECIARAGSLEGGLKHYVGAANTADDGGYAAKVLAEHARLQQVAAGRAPPATAPQPVRAAAKPPCCPAPEPSGPQALALAPVNAEPTVSSPPDETVTEVIEHEP